MLIDNFYDSQISDKKVFIIMFKSIFVIKLKDKHEKMLVDSLIGE